jgi:hypothetical protein
LIAQVESLLPSIEAESSPIRTAYEEADSSRELTAARDQAADQVDAATVVSTAVAMAEVERGPIERLGLLGVDVETVAASAVAAVESMDFAASEAAAHQVTLALDGAMSAGLGRLGAALAAIAALLLGAWAFARRRRPARLTAQAALVSGVAASEPAEDRPGDAAAKPPLIGGEPIGAEFRAIDSDQA